MIEKYIMYSAAGLDQQCGMRRKLKAIKTERTDICPKMLCQSV